METMNLARIREQEKKIEQHLRKYSSYKTAMRNVEKELDYILPSVTANYEYREGSAGTFSIYSTTENVAIDRIESRKALFLNEERERLRILVESIESAISVLSDEEKVFIRLRYFENKSYTEIQSILKLGQNKAYATRKGILESLRISLVSLLM